MDCNFPEMLARDLEMSEAVFLSKRMTAGAPLPELALGRSCSLSAGSGNNIPTRAAQYHRILTTIRSLGELEEWDCTKLDEAVEHNNGSTADAGPSPDSMSESSVGIEPRCTRCREPSVTTAPTSVTSRRCSSPLQTPPLPYQSSSPMQKNPQNSWVDLGPDDDIGDRSRTSSEAPLMDEQPPSPSLIGHDGEVMEKKQPQTDTTSNEGEGAFVSFHLPVNYNPAERPRTSSGASLQDKPGWVGTQQPIILPKRRSSLRQQLDLAEPRVEPDSPSKSTSSITGTASCPAGEAKGHGSPSSTAHATACDSSGTAIDASLPLDESGYQDQVPKDIEVTKEEDLSDEPSAEEPPKAGPSPHHVHNWVESGMGIELSPLLSKHLEHSAPGIPLPPEVIETLRISVVCFPETMLLSSSLTIETIRSYSKKFRHDDNHSGPDDQSILSFGTSAVDTPKRWKLSNLLSPRRVGPPKMSWSKPTSVPSSPRYAILPGGVGTASSPNWSPLKNIFPTGSDYLCDALYAHLVAYNYITTICGPGHQTMSTGQNDSFGTSGTRGSAEPDGRNPSSPIPKKAASLLGLSGVVIGAARTRIPGSASGMIGGNRKKLFTGGDDSGEMDPRSPANDPAMRELQAGLGKCISRLVATLKLTGEPSARDSAGTKAETAAVEVDGLLLRALCEVVRCSEEKR